MRKNIILLISCFLFLHVSQANAESTEQEAQLKNYVNSLMDKGHELFNDEKLSKEERAQKSSKLIQDNLHLDWMAKYSLGRYRRTISDDKLQEFVKTYSQFVVNSYAELTKNYSGQRAKLKKVNKLDEKRFIVAMEIQQPGNNSALHVDYLIHLINGQGFKVADIITEGISTLNSHQSEFTSYIAEKGIDDLIKDLKQKASR